MPSASTPASEMLGGDPRVPRVLTAIFVDIMERSERDGSMPCLLPTVAICSMFYGDNPNSITHVNYLRKNYPEIPRTICHFLMRARTSEDRQRLAGVLDNVCSCPPDALDNNRLLRELHGKHLHSMIQFSPSISHAQPPLDRVLNTFMLYLRHLVDNTFAKVSVRRLLEEGVDAARYGRRPPWPMHQNDILPYGLSRSMESLCSWTDVFLSINLTSLLASLNARIVDMGLPGLFIRTIIPVAVIPVLEDHLNQCEGLAKRNLVTNDWLWVNLNMLINWSLRDLDDMDDRQLRLCLVDVLLLFTD